MSNEYYAAFSAEGTQAHKDILEGLIDSMGLEHVVRRLSEVCHEKGAHLVDNWQDTNTASDWFNASGVLDLAHEDLVAIALP